MQRNAAGSTTQDTSKVIATLPGRIIALVRHHLGRGLNQLLELADQQMARDPDRTMLGDGPLTVRMARNRLAEKASILQSAFLDDLCEPLLPGTVVQTAARHAPTSLELVDDEELELWLIRSEASAQLERATGAALVELKPRLASLAEQLPGLSAELLLPENVLNGLIRAFKQVELEYSLRHLLMQYCGDAVLLQLTALYPAMLERLRAADIGPSTVVPLRPNEKGPSGGFDRGVQARPRPPTADPVHAGHPVFAHNRPPAQTRDALAATHQVFALTARPDASTAPNAPVIANEILLQALQQLTHLEQSAPTSAVDFSQAMQRTAAQLAGTESVALAPEQTEAVTLLSRLYEALTGDPMLPPSFRQWIHRLLPALLGTQLSEGDLAEHGDWIRQLFALLEFGAVLCENRSDAPSRQLAERIEELVGPLASRPSLDLSVLERSCQALDQLLQRHRRAGAAVEDRVIEACEGQQRLEDARRIANKELGLLFGGRQVPVALAELLDESIRPRLVLAQLRGDQGEWDTQLGLLRDLAEVCGAVSQGEQTPADALLSRLKRALSDLDSPGNRQEELLQVVSSNLATTTGPWIDYRSDSSSETVLPKGPSAAPDLRLELLKPGDWMAFGAHEAEPRLLKLAWHAPDYARFVFVNQLGHKAEDLSNAELAHLLQTQKAQILDEGNASIIERAWRKMLEGLHNELAEQATHDALTGLLNRKEFDRRLLSALAGPQRQDLALLWVGVDHLRMLNQTHGMAAGDAALQAIAQNLRRFVQRGAHTARIAGDEFALLLEGASDERAMTVARNLSREIAERELHWQDHPYRLSVSVGVVMASADSVDPEALLQDAERAYRLAREDGGGKIYRHQADDERLAKLRQTASWVSRIEQALEQGTLVLYGQPAMSLSPAAKAGPDYMEVLLRMQSGDGLHTPEQFLLAAERYGQIAAVDRFVLNELLSKLRRLPSHVPLLVAFNLSARNLVDNDFISEMIARLRQQDFPCEQLCVELTETAAIAQLAQARRGMARLRELGLALVLDDFGSGYSSYQYLKHLPVDVVKVDGAFIRDIARAPEDLALARSINEIAHLLGKRTVAEHVEDEATLELVRDIGFDYAQGYFIRRPEPLDGLLEAALSRTMTAAQVRRQS
jgi:diguanylate cyclase (GGDEF)-like protein